MTKAKCKDPTRQKERCFHHSFRAFAPDRMQTIPFVAVLDWEKSTQRNTYAAQSML